MSEQAIEKTACLIIGSGPAGYTAGIYAARADLKPILYQGMVPGGQLTETSEVENFPGYPDGTQGPEMMEDMKKQAERFGTEIRFGRVTEIDTSKRPFMVKVDDGKVIEAETVILSTGASARWLGLKSEKEYNGYGVSACATCDGFFYRGKVVAVIGGGDTALEDASYLAKLASKVYLVHRRDEFRASKAMQNRIFATENIEIVWDSTVKEITGEQTGFAKAVTGCTLENVKTKEERKLELDGVFVAIGHKPNSNLVKDVVDTDAVGYIVTKPDSTMTKIDGLFAAGDVQDSKYRQAVTAAGSGCMAAIEAERFLAEQG